MLTLLTATGARPEAWAICQKLMSAQNYADAVKWVIVDDGPEPQAISFNRAGWELQIIRPEPLWQSGQNTQRRNLLAGLEAVPDDAGLIIVEDDDYYAPGWLTKVSTELAHGELVGEIHARYYNVAKHSFRELTNAAHASLCSTAMRGYAIGRFRAECRRNNKFIDMNLWQKHKSKHLFKSHLVTGIKGLPGREGIGMGHKQNFKGQPDTDGIVLRQWVGADAELYL